MTRIFQNLCSALLVCGAAGLLCAGDTRTWTQGQFADFEKGEIKSLSLRSDGVLSLAPQTKEWFDSSAMYLWSLARDSKGNLYTGGGSGAKLYRIGTDGKGKVLAELDALEIHGIAVDSKDRVYAATAPDGKVYRIAANGKAEVFYDPKAKYIWALAFDRQDNLYVATGDPGQIHRVTPDSKGKLFFDSEETHVRSLALDGAGNLIAGTEPGGLVIRVSPAGEGFVLYQIGKREVTAVAVGRDGAIYAAGVGSRQNPAPPPLAAPPPVQAAAAQNNAQPVARVANPAPLLTAAPLGVTGGSDIYEIAANGSPRRLWTSAQDVVYALAFDASGALLAGAGNKGNVFRIDSPARYTSLLSVPAGQVTAFQNGPDGRLYAATGNVGKVYEIGPGVEPQGSIESDVFDAGLFTRWGRLSFEGSSNGGQITLQTRSGNLDQPQKNWSPWSPPISAAEGGRIASPASRFVQWKATLTAAAGKSPDLDSVELAYLPQNVRPHVDRIEITPANFRFPAQIAAIAIQTVALPPLVRQPARSSEGPNPLTDTPATPTPSLQSAKGFIGARWLAADPNGDSLVYSVDIRGVNETEWKPLKDKVPEKYFSWDSTAFPDGEYKIRVTASDAPSNPPPDALTGGLESEPFLIDNTPPKITALTAARNSGKLEIRWHAADALSHIAKAEYSLDGGDWTVVSPAGVLSDSRDLDYTLELTAALGEHTIAVRVEDAYANQSVDKAVVH